MPIKQIQGGKVYASTSFVTDYLQSGRKKFPAIHDSVAAVLALVPKDERKGAIDFGACHGMLSLRAHSMGWFPVVGLEADAPSVDLHRELLGTLGVALHKVKLDLLSPQTISFLSDTIRQSRVSTFICRRILPELFSTSCGQSQDPEKVEAVGRAFGRLALENGIRHIVLEGRAYSVRSVHPLANTAAEVRAIGPGWRVAGSHKQAVLLVPS